MSDIKGISVNGTQYSIEDETARTALNSKYVKPAGGIPASDLASAVQTSLGKADGAIPAPSSPASGDVLKYNGSAWIADESDGLSSGIKQALLNCFAHVAWTDEHGQDYYDALEAALNPPADLVSISAVYTQSGTVYDTDTLDSLRADLVVTATYDDSTTETVTTYTLSGTLTEGTSTITVSYGGKTDTFTVTVTVPQWDYTWTPASGTFDNAGFTVIQGSDRITYDSAGATIVGKTDTASAPKITIPETSSHFQIEYVIQPVAMSSHSNSGFHANLTYGGGKYTAVRTATKYETRQSVYGVTRYTTGTYTNIDTVHYVVGTDYKVLIDYNALGNLKIYVDDVQILDVAVGSASSSNGNILWVLDGTYMLKSVKCKAVV